MEIFRSERNAVFPFRTDSWISGRTGPRFPKSVRGFDDDAIASTNDKNVIINVFYEILGRFTNQLDYGRTIKTP